MPTLLIVSRLGRAGIASLLLALLLGAVSLSGGAARAAVPGPEPYLDPQYEKALWSLLGAQWPNQFSDSEAALPADEQGAAVRRGLARARMAAGALPPLAHLGEIRYSDGGDPASIGWRVYRSVDTRWLHFGGDLWGSFAPAVPASSTTVANVRWVSACPFFSAAPGCSTNASTLDRAGWVVGFSSANGAKNRFTIYDATQTLYPGELDPPEPPTTRPRCYYFYTDYYCDLGATPDEKDFTIALWRMQAGLPGTLIPAGSGSCVLGRDGHPLPCYFRFLSFEEMERLLAADAFETFVDPARQPSYQQYPVPPASSAWGLPAAPDLAKARAVLAEPFEELARGWVNHQLDLSYPDPFGPSVPAEQLVGAQTDGDLHWNLTTEFFGDPVNSATGAFVSSATDVALPAIGVPFTFTRSYTSSDASSGALGRGWTHNLSAALTVEADGDAVFRSEGGGRATFTRQGDGSFRPRPGVHSTLSRIGGGYELVRRDQVRYRFDDAGRFTSLRDRNGQGLALAYDPGGRLATVSDSAGRSIAFAYDASGLLTRIGLPDGRSVSYGYTSGLLTSVTDLRGGAWGYRYAAAGRLDRELDPNGSAVVTNVYGSDGRVSAQTDALGHSTSFAWDAATQTATATDARGNAWQDVYRNNVLQQRLDPLGNTSSYEYDAALNRVAVTDARGNSTRFAYDSAGNVTKATAPAPLSHEQHFAYNPRNDLVSATDGRGNTTGYEYDAAGNLVAVTEPGAVVTRYVVDPLSGLPASVTDPLGQVTRLAYDGSGGLVRVASPLGAVTTMRHDPAGRLVGLVEPRGNEAGMVAADYETTYAYDAAGNLLREADPLGHATSYEYDQTGNLTAKTDALGRTTRYGYDAANRLVSVTAPDGTVTSYAYDGVANLTSRTDANSHTTSYAYDATNRLASVTSPLGQRWAYTYDGSGNLTRVVDAAGAATGYGYDVLDRLVGIDYADATPDVGYSYDANGNRVELRDGQGVESYVYDPLDRLTAVSRGLDTFTYAYDAGSRLVRRGYPDGSGFTYGYDEEGKLVSVSAPGGLVGYGYDVAGNLLRTTLPSENGFAESRAYDRAGRLVELRNASASRTISYEALMLDAVGNPLAIETKPDDGEPGETDANQHTTTYRYDLLDRLSEVCFKANCAGAADPFIRWSYDAVGNRLSETRADGTTTYAYNAGDQVLSRSGLGGEVAYGYDANGNQTRAGDETFAYDLANRMVAASAGGMTTAYGYDGDGKRVSVGGARHLWDVNQPLPQLALERDSAGQTLRRYSYGLDRISMSSGGEYFFHKDHLGSVLNVSSASGRVEWSYSYEPFGATRRELRHGANAPANAQLFAGEHRDSESGLYHLRARQYDPASGRFTATDPLAPRLSDPYVSSYVYANQRPTYLVDPTGSGAVTRSLAAAGLPEARPSGSGGGSALLALLVAAERALARIVYSGGPVSGMRILAHTQRNFRTNLIRWTGHVRLGHQAHHIFPKAPEFAREWARLGVNPNNPMFGTWWEATSHLRNAAAYNTAWRNFLFRGGPRTKDDVLNFGRHLGRRYGLDVYF